MRAVEIEAEVRKRVDEFVEIPVFGADGEPFANLTLKLRPGALDCRTELEIGHLTIEVESIGIERALRLVEQER